jgi:hypothetical protein
MENQRFDRIVRFMASSRSRRGAFALALASVVGGVAPAATAAKTAKKAKKKRGRGVVGTACKRKRTCRGGAVCQDGICVCPSGTGRCGERCKGPDYCGAGNACDPGDQIDVCAGASTCAGRVDGQTVCCGLAGVHVCEGFGDAYCCSGVCQKDGPDAGLCG